MIYLLTIGSDINRAPDVCASRINVSRVFRSMYNKNAGLGFIFIKKI